MPDAEIMHPPEALSLWLTCRQSFQQGTPYRQEFKKLASLLPVAIVALPEWQTIQKHAAHPPATRTALSRDLLALLATHTAADTDTTETTMLARVQAHLAKHVRVMRSDAFAESELRDVLTAHALHGELSVAARLIQERSKDPELRAWRMRYARRIEDMRAITTIEKAIIALPAPAAITGEE